jgi:hypothetical protein
MTTTHDKDEIVGPERFKLIWRGGKYYVSEPEIDTCEVVRADLYDQLKRELDRLKPDYKISTFDLVAVEKERDRYRAALEYYGKEENWHSDDDTTYIMKRPGGMQQIGIMLTSNFLKPWIMARDAISPPDQNTVKEPGVEV